MTSNTHEGPERRAAVRRRYARRNDAEAHRLRGRARVMAATGSGPTRVLRIEITNAFCGSDYTARLLIGSGGAAANVILDTGSSTLAVEPKAYSGAGDADLAPSTLLQLVTYVTGGWAGPVVDTTLTLGTAADAVTLPNCPIALTSVQEEGNFQGVDGIMGLAYNGLNEAFDFKAYLAREGKTSTYPWPFREAWEPFSEGFGEFVQTAGAIQIYPVPYFDQIEEAGIVANRFAFYTLRSFVSFRRGESMEAILGDPLNKGFFILGGGDDEDEAKDELFTGEFSTVQVVHDQYYNTNLVSVRVDGGVRQAVAPLQQKFREDAVSNAIIDSGTSNLSLAEDVFQAVLRGLEKMNPAFLRAIKDQTARHELSAASLDLAEWPNIYFTFEGLDGAAVELTCTPQTYWQTDYPQAGRAVFQISGPPGGGAPGDQPNQSIFGLPLMNNYYTVFDRSLDVNGVIRFATIKPPEEM